MGKWREEERSLGNWGREEYLMASHTHGGGGGGRNKGPLTDSLVVEVEYLGVLGEAEPVPGLDDDVVDGAGAEVPQHVRAAHGEVAVVAVAVAAAAHGVDVGG